MKAALSLLAVLLLSGAAGAAEDMAPMALNSFSGAPARIAAAPVLDQQGNRLGKVKAVATDQDGRPSALSYTTPDNRLMIVAAPAVSYDGQKNIVVADVSRQQQGERVAVN
jgi:hypothetical protein